ncbi:D-2-hydroxyacid dehydrogenase [Arsenicicoccus sp. oral taxon 190]|uniref:D-2-hydroxyacid dehydrogenase n=1 Tax=Arsenicicoccus sp. oral taxon 190 TaxID=1658671 RepID=UPI000679FC3A|nr:D-2-hydroxyacid dehydrogenase [Arsenicicoccus sp. oral taxon 190]AKT50749.1 2-hydroxyacid dehydrogenase [Arsenicicoccus sp. oral taxon 190]
MSQPRPRLVVLTADGTQPPGNEAALRSLADLRYATEADLAEALPGADVLFSWDFFSGALRAAWPAADALRWVHVAAAGVDAMLFGELAESSVVVTNSRGVFDQPIAEFVLASVLAHDKLLHESKALQRRHEWRHREVTRTAGRHVLVVGTGAIGRACGQLLRAAGLQVRGAGRRAVSGDPDLGEIVLTSELAQHVGWADHVVLIAPLTPQTRHVVSAEVLAAMKPTAHLINVGRGALVDETALVAALQRGEIAAASLDVVETEPLPDDSPLWDLEQVALSAHMCGDVVGWRDELAALFEDNLRRYVAGRSLRNVVDKHSGFVARG